MAALSDMAANSSRRDVWTGGDHDFRNSMVVAFYAQFLSPEKTVHYVKRENWAQRRPEWILTHSQDVDYQPYKRLRITGIGDYRLFGEYRFSGVSGWGWFVYRNENAK